MTWKQRAALFIPTVFFFAITVRYITRPEDHKLLKKGECVTFAVPAFQEKVCTHKKFQVDRPHYGKHETYIAKTYYYDVRQGCDSEFSFEYSAATKIECPEDF